ncbi:receptor-like protein kinase HSL1 [Zingiber officinale]|uniref:non-specific serine/threonine protein kinase n=1 Tax=Zingiber officinale TaxID=94328 RepID=A0A8J5H8J9_ZINOF|nr:receptor-like protein kinase HSL1 [Zingiber officinale]KAG6523090.1 hypothetical protein ZIOFF_012943 [Zingiber officinale]
MSSLFLLLLLLLVSGLFRCGLGLTDDGHRLLEAKAYLYDPDDALADWSPSDATPCNWTGVSCEAPPQFPAVAALDLSGLGLSGTFPPPLCRLPRLHSLSLASNSLNSSLLPDALLGCSSLTRLDLSQNYFTGYVPADLPSLLPYLEHLDLSVNNFSGQLPHSFSQFSSLRSLAVVGNLLSGPIPAFLSNLSSLGELNLSYNPFDPSPLPPSLANLTSLRVLWLASCNILGRIPPELGRLSYLTDLDLSYNSLSGMIPDSLAGLSSIVQIELYSNELTGFLPGSLSNLTELLFFDASTNHLSGKIPEDVFLAPELKSFNLYENNLTGAVPSTLGGCRNLAELRLFSNRLVGPLPDELGKNSPLSFVDLSDNLLSGEIPAGICDGGALEQLLLLDNFFTGPLPERLGQCSTLTRVRLSKNRLSGEIPPSFWGLPQVLLLDLTENSFTGGISPSISGAANLSKLMISDNQFDGRIPDEMGALSNLYGLSAANNQLTGSLPATLLNLAELGQLDLHSNSLSGDIPTDVGSWKNLIELNLADNEFTGSIPAALGDLPVLNYVDLSDNKLTGEIPNELQNLKTNRLNLSNNQLSGTLPPFFATQMYKDSFLGNPALCVSESCGRRGGSSTHHGSGRWLRSIFVLFSMSILAAAAWCYWKRQKEKQKKVKLDTKKPNWKLTPFHKLNFSEQEMLNCLNEDNVIGAGDSGKVYRATLSGGQAVAVKQVQESSGVDHRNRFEEEAAALGKIMHKNIAKLWCCCIHNDSKLLVYEYMPNGNLGDLLHSSNSRLLDWPARYKIAVGAAAGLSYLHHDCVPPIIHRDVKSNNILLDEEFEAKIAMSISASSGGYIAPEYAYTRHVNEKSDVYSFGVVILELVTGRRGVDPEPGEKDLVKWTCNVTSRKGVDHVLDPKLDLCFQEEIRKVLNVGLLCTSYLPINRPPMRRVVNMLLEAAPQRRLKPANTSYKAFIATSAI